MRLGSVHRYWLAVAEKKGTSGLTVGDYSDTSHAVAIQGLINMGLVKVKTHSDPEIMVVEITALGKIQLHEERKIKKRHM